jgi:membrane fusion protein (multidrug efflux system)
MTEEAPAETAKKHTKIIWITIGIFLFLGVAYFAYWFLWGRFHEYTNDAYVDGNMVMVTPQVPGIVTALTALSTDFVCKGRVLVQLDQTDARIALDKSIAGLGDAVRQVEQLFENVNVLYASMAMKKALFIRAAQDFERRKALIDEGAVSVEDLQHVVADLNASYADFVSTEHAYVAAVAQVEGTTPFDHPLVESGKNQLRDTFVFLQRCTITAPTTGIVAQRTVQVGEHVDPGQPLLAIVPLNEMWVTANFKETQLCKMRIGQKAKVTSDIYGRHVVYQSTVVGIGGGTGSVFSVLPAQNATGNWIKIVQRIPVKIDVPIDMLQNHPLRLGLSMEVTVDLHDQQLSMIPASKPDIPIYATDVFATQEEGAELLIEQVIADNLSDTFLQNMQPEKNP